MTFRVFVAVVVIAQALSAFGEDSANDRLRGIWFGDGRHPMSRTVLLIHHNRFVVITPLGAFTSTFVANDEPALAEIDIERYDGDHQFGVYEIAEQKLRIKLGKPNGPRPTSKDVRFPNGKPHWHTVFRRSPTMEGIEVLQKHLPTIREN